MCDRHTCDWWSKVGECLPLLEPDFFDGADPANQCPAFSDADYQAMQKTRQELVEIQMALSDEPGIAEITEAADRIAPAVIIPLVDGVRVTSLLNCKCTDHAGLIEEAASRGPVAMVCWDYDPHQDILAIVGEFHTAMRLAGHDCQKHLPRSPRGYMSLVEVACDVA